MSGRAPAALRGAPGPPRLGAVLRITDARTGASTEATAVRRGLTRVTAHVPRADATGLRVLLAADLLVRALELQGTPVWAVLAGREGRAELREEAAELGIRPFEDQLDVGTTLGGARGLHVVGAGGEEVDGVRVEVAPADWDAVPPEPAALRLALLGHARHEAVTLGADALAEAAGTLARLRAQVAAWATRPSRPVPEAVRGRLRTAWEDDLDVPAVLEELRAAGHAPDLPDGARFETYAYADRLLGLDLVRDVGRAAGP